VRYAPSRDCWDIEGMGDKIVELLVTGQLVTDVADCAP
jgi:NAD-dependent DNA ligase